MHVGGDFISAVFDGTFHPASFDDTRIVRDFSSIPYFDGNGKQVQLLISEYSMNTILKTIIDLDYINGNKTFNSDEIQSIVPDFEQPFGTQDKI